MLEILRGVILQNQNYLLCLPVVMIWDSTIDILTYYGLDDQGILVHVLVMKRFFFSPHYPEQFWGLSGLQSFGHLMDSGNFTFMCILKIWIGNG
jgi:hypothetical protein